MNNMGRKNKPSHLSRNRGNFADQEKRGKRLKAFRMVVEDDSLGIAGVVSEALADNEDFPQVRSVPSRHKVFVLDPRIVRREFSSGFRAGYNFGRAHENTLTTAEQQPDEIEARIGRVVLLGPKSTGRRIVAGYIESKELQQERRSLYECLAQAGLRGFDRREHKTPPSPVIVLAHLATPVHDPGMRRDIGLSIEDTLIEHRAHEFTMLDLVVRTDD